MFGSSVGKTCWTGVRGIGTCINLRNDYSPWLVERFWVSQGESNAGFWGHEVNLALIAVMNLSWLIRQYVQFSKHATCTSTFDVECYGPDYKKHQDVVDFFLAVRRAFSMFPTFDMLAACADPCLTQ